MVVREKMRRKSPWIVLVLAVVLVSGLVSGLARAAASSESPSSDKSKTILRIGITAAPDSLNPFVGYESSSWEVFRLNYNNLLGFDAKTLEPTPELASEVPTKANGGISADGKTYTFKLRHNVKWQDGEPFTAKDVVFTFNYIMKNQLSQYTSYTTGFKSVTALDDYTVQIKTAKPIATLDDLWVPIVPEHIWSKVSPKAAAGSFQNSPPIVGTGPFQTVENKNAKYVRLVANKDYFLGAPKVDEVILEVYQSADTMVQDLKNGTIQAAYGFASSGLPSLKSTPTVDAFDYVTKGFDELAFNCYTGAASKGSPACRDVNFRRAMNYAIDKDKIVAITYSGYARAGSSLCQSDYWQAPYDYHWDPASTGDAYTYDPAKCKQLLDAAGYKDVNGDGDRELPNGKPMDLRLWTRSASTTSQNSGKLIAGYFKAAGVKTTLSVIDDGAISDGCYNMKGDTYAPDFDMFIWGWGGDPDPNFILSVFTSDQVGGGWSDCGWQNKQYDALVAAQRVELDKQKRVDLVHQAEKIFYDQSPYIILSYPNDIEAVATNQNGKHGSWTGWIAAPGLITNKTHGGVFYTCDNIDSYVAVAPVTGSTDEGSSGSNTTKIVVIVIIVVAVIVILAIVLLRRGRRRVEVE
jgi:peptide/nickel transport system substrate-binding protein